MTNIEARYFQHVAIVIIHIFHDFIFFASLRLEYIYESF